VSRDGSAALGSAVARWRQARVVAKVDEAPGCVYGLLTREDLSALVVEVSRLRDSVTWTNRLLVGLLVSIVLSVVGLLLRGIPGP
jgi:hypothetical protein